MCMCVDRCHFPASRILFSDKRVLKEGKFPVICGHQWPRHTVGSAYLGVGYLESYWGR